MTDQTAIVELAPIGVGRDDGWSDDRDEVSLAGALRKNCLGIALGIVVAGGAYPVIVAVAFFGYLFLIRELGFVELLGNVIPALFGVGAGTLVGFAWAGIVAGITLPLIYLVVRSLRVQGGVIWLGAFSGGLVGFMCVMPIFLNGDINDDFGPFWAVVLVLAIGPGSTTLLGQVGGAVGAWYAIRRPQRYEPGMSQPMLSSADASAESQPDDGSQTKQPPWQGIRFGTRHLLWATGWLSLLLSLIRMCGVPFEFVLPLLAGWIVFQAATLWIGGRVMARLARS